MPSYIIGEAGVNHDGDINKAKLLIDIAKESGCNCVKFQTFKTENIVTKNAKKADYQVNNTNNNESQYNMLKRLELGYEDFYELKHYCDEKNIDFLSSPFDFESVDLLEKIGVNAYKLSSGEITNKPLIKYVAKKQKKVILSTGMSTMDEVEAAVNWIKEENNFDIVLLHCTSNYPADYSSVNMKAMIAMKEKFDLPVGYSDHTEGIAIPILATAFGSVVIEKHFTYDKNADGPDHKASLEPEELKQMVAEIRKVESAIGNGIKCPTNEELSTKIAARKSIVWLKDIDENTIIRLDDLCIKRPGDGIPPYMIEDLVGKKTTRKCYKDNCVKKEDYIDL